MSKDIGDISFSKKIGTKLRQIVPGYARKVEKIRAAQRTTLNTTAKNTAAESMSLPASISARYFLVDQVEGPFNGAVDQLQSHHRDSASQQG